MFRKLPMYIIVSVGLEPPPSRYFLKNGGRCGEMATLSLLEEYRYIQAPLPS